MKAFSLKAAFTLIELIVVIIIIGILASVAVPAYNSYVQSSKDKSNRSLEKTINQMIDLYYADYGEYPSMECGTGSAANQRWLSLDANGNYSEYCGSSNSFHHMIREQFKGFPFNSYCTGQFVGKTWEEVASVEGRVVYESNIYGDSIYEWFSPDDGYIATGMTPNCVDSSGTATANCNNASYRVVSVTYTKERTGISTVGKCGN